MVDKEKWYRKVVLGDRGRGAGHAIFAIPAAEPTSGAGPAILVGPTQEESVHVRLAAYPNRLPSIPTCESVPPRLLSERRGISLWQALTPNEG